MAKMLTFEEQIDSFLVFFYVDGAKHVGGETKGRKKAARVQGYLQTAVALVKCIRFSATKRIAYLATRNRKFS